MIKRIKNTFIYFSAEGFSKFIPFSILPLVTHYLTPAEYGKYSMYLVILSFLSAIIMMNMQSHITRNFYNSSREKISSIISSILVIFILNSILVMFCILIYLSIFDAIFSINNKLLLILIPIMIFIQGVNNITFTILRNYELAFKYGLLKISSTVIGSFTLILFLIMNYGWESLVYSLILANFVIFLYSLFFINKNFPLFKEFYPLKEIYIFSIPLIFYSLGGTVVFLFDRIFINHFLGEESVGIYSLGVQFSLPIIILFNSLIMAINPSTYRSLSLGKYSKFYSNAYILSIVMITFSVVMWKIMSLIMPYTINHSYIKATEVLFWLYMAFGFKGLYQIFHPVIIHSGKTYVLVYIIIGVALINIILNYLLIPINGIVGAAQSTLISFFIMFFSTYIFSKKFLREDY